LLQPVARLQHLQVHFFRIVKVWHEVSNSEQSCPSTNGSRIADQAEQVTVGTTVSAESIIYQIRKKPNSNSIESGKPEIRSLHLYIDGHLIARDCFIYTDSPGPINAKLGFRTADAPEILRRLSELLEK